MEPLGIISGFAAFMGAKVFKKPLRKVTVLATSQIFNAVDRSKEVFFNAKEGFEDIIAEAHYENMKRHNQIEPENNQRGDSFNEITN